MKQSVGIRENSYSLFCSSQSQWSKFSRSFILIPHSAGFKKSLKINPGKNNPKNFTYFLC